MPANTWLQDLEALLYGVRYLFSRGVSVGTERNDLNFAAPMTATDDTVNLRTNITITWADVGAAAIPGAAVDPDFGAQDVTLENTYSYQCEDAAGAAVDALTMTAADYLALGKNDANLNGVTIVTPTGTTIQHVIATTTKFAVSASAVTSYTNLLLNANATYLRGTDLAGTGTVNMIGMDASDVLQVGQNDTDLEGIELAVPTGKRTIASVAGTTVLTVASDALTAEQPVVLPSYTVVGLPAAASYTRALAWCSDETGGATVVFSDGTNWRRVNDYTVAS